jgi:hypothetical protein
MPIDPSELTKSIGAIGTLDPEAGLAPTLQQIVVAAKQLFEADAAGLMLIDREGRLRWASATDQTAQTLGGRPRTPGPRPLHSCLQPAGPGGDP